jgi:paired small multidrug resistance pump
LPYRRVAPKVFAGLSLAKSNDRDLGKAEPFARKAAQPRRKGQEFNLDYGWFDLVGNIGVLLMVIAYLLLQLEKLSSSAVSYLVLNTVGAVLLIISLTFRFNLSAFLMEAFWLLISLYGLAKPLFSKRAV